jgi:2-(3-amino-3-carboxypropyl)histidine synthase
MIDSTSKPNNETSNITNSVEEALTAALSVAVARDEAEGKTAAITSGTAAKPKRKVRRIVRKKDKKLGGKDDDSDVVDPVLLEKVMMESCLPKAYSFEIVKTLKRINQILQTKHTESQKKRNHQNENSYSSNNNPQSNSSVHIALQMPEGLLLYATVLSDVLQRLVAATNKTITNHSDQPLLRVSVLGDVTYGACCVDDLGARALGCDLLVHYGHSCLVPIQHTVVPCLYVFVEITIDVPHLVECFHQTILLENKKLGTTIKPHVYLLGTIQFRHALMEARRLLRSEPYEYDLSIPQAKPLSPGEVLGCTSPVLASTPPAPKSRKEKSTTEEVVIDSSNNTTIVTNGTDVCLSSSNQRAVVLFVADGRFHLESTMISNPHISKFYRYDPYPKTLTEESYDHIKMKSIRYEAIEKARLKIQTKKQLQQQSGSSSGPAVFGIILGTLGRQGNPALLTKLRNQLTSHKLKSFVILASEITPSKLALFRNKVDAWVQIACPRLSVDWGHALSGDSSVPVLNPYELFVTLDCTNTLWRGGDDKSYPMDYYSQEGGPWSNYGDADNKGRQFTTVTVAV